MALNTLAQAQTRAQMNALVRTLQLKGMTVGRGPSYVSACDKDGKKKLSAISARGTLWSTQMDAELAKELNHPLWKDM
jgi:hypothetical protein